MPLSNKKRPRQRRSVADSPTIAAATGPPIPSSNRQGGRPGNPPRTGVAHPPPPLFDHYTTLEKKEEEEEEAYTCIGMMEPRPAAAGESSKGGDKGRRFSEEQIRLMETMFEAQAKLEPRQKLELARELGLQPRQVAIWFQNKRARWKSKQLEREYRALKAEHEALLASFNSLKKEKQILLAQLRALEELLEKADERRSNEGDAASEREQRAARLSLKEEPELKLAGSADEEADLGQPASFSMASAAAAAAATEQQFWFTNTTTTTAAAATSSWPSEQSGSHSQWWEFWPLRG